MLPVQTQARTRPLCFDLDPSKNVISPASRLRLERGVVSRINRLFQKFLRGVLPELGNIVESMDHRVLKLSAHSFDFSYVDILYGIVIGIESHGPTGDVL